MQKQSQPQTTNNSNVRDASVQIRAGRHTPGPYDKYRAILTGIEKKEKETHPEREKEEIFQYSSRIHYGMACELALIIQNLTSVNKEDRERAKAKVREMVKLGKEAEQ